jgi:phenylalanyl-tRNA synthetase alpha chain
VENSIDQIYQEALKAIETAAGLKDVQSAYVHYLGRKGILTQFLRNISSLPVEQRPAAGKRANEIKKKLEVVFKEAFAKSEKPTKGAADHIDVSLPGRPAVCGSLHPITQINQEICDIFLKMGFEIAEGPEVELDYYNFEALNFPKDHPISRPSIFPKIIRLEICKTRFLFQTISS